jgi:hypothetical protein
MTVAIPTNGSKSVRERVEERVAEDIDARNAAICDLEQRIKDGHKRWNKAFTKWNKSGQDEDYRMAERTQNACLGMRANQRRIREELKLLSSPTTLERRVEEAERLAGLRESKRSAAVQDEINSELEEHVLTDKDPFKIRACVVCGRPCRINVFAPPPKCLDHGGVYRGGK